MDITHFYFEVTGEGDASFKRYFDSRRQLIQASISEGWFCSMFFELWRWYDTLIAGDAVLLFGWEIRAYRMPDVS